MKKLLLLLLSVTSFTLSAQDVKTVVPTNWVTDLGNFYTPEEEVKLNSLITDYEKQTSIEIGILTVESLNGEPIEEVADKFFNRVGIGKKGADNGLLIVFSKERLSRIELGNGIEPFFNDVDSYNALEAIKPNFRAGNFYLGTVDCLNYVKTKLGNQPFENKVLWKKQRDAKIKKQEEAQAEAVKSFFINASFVALFFFILGYIYYLDKKKRARIAAELEAKRLEEERLAKLAKDITNNEEEIKRLIKFKHSSKLSDSKIIAFATKTLNDYIENINLDNLKASTDEKYLSNLINEKSRIYSRIKAFNTAEKEVEMDISSINYLNINLKDLEDANKTALLALDKIEKYGYTNITYQDQKSTINGYLKHIEDVQTLLKTDIDGAITKSKSLKTNLESLKRGATYVTDYLGRIESAKSKVLNADGEVNSVISNIKRYNSYLKPGELDRFTNEYTAYKTKSSNDFLATALLLGTLLISGNKLLSTVRGRKEDEERRIREEEEAARRKREAEARRRRDEEEAERRRRDSYSSSSSSYGSSSGGSSWGGFDGGGSSGGGASNSW